MAKSKNLEEKIDEALKLLREIKVGKCSSGTTPGEGMDA